MSAQLAPLRRPALLLRDFFAARTREELRAAYAALAAHMPDGFPPLGDAEAARLEYAFNRLFVGPDALPAPPYASVYLDADPLHMGPSTLDMRALLHSLGLAAPHDGQPDDFLPYELEAWHALTLLLDGKEYRLYEGDSVYFRSTIPHKYLNTDKEDCVSVWAMTPTFF